MPDKSQPRPVQMRPLVKRGLIANADLHAAADDLARPASGRSGAKVGDRN